MLIETCDSFQNNIAPRHTHQSCCRFQRTGLPDIHKRSGIRTQSILNNEDTKWEDNSDILWNITTWTLAVRQITSDMPCFELSKYNSGIVMKVFTNELPLNTELCFHSFLHHFLFWNMISGIWLRGFSQWSFDRVRSQREKIKTSPLYCALDMTLGREERQTDVSVFDFITGHWGTWSRIQQVNKSGSVWLWSTTEWHISRRA